jgi:hypothetical protein
MQAFVRLINMVAVWKTQRAGEYVVPREELEAAQRRHVLDTVCESLVQEVMASSIEAHDMIPVVLSRTFYSPLSFPVTHPDDSSSLILDCFLGYIENDSPWRVKPGSKTLAEMCSATLVSSRYRKWAVEHGLDEDWRKNTPPWISQAASFVSAGSPEGCLTALKQMSRPERTVLESAEYIIAAIVRLTAYKRTLINKITPPDWAESTIRATRLNWTHGGGIMPNKRSVVETADAVFHAVWIASKKEGFMASCVQLVDIVTKLKRQLRAKGIVYSLDCFPLIIAKLAFKPELREPGTDRLKTRIFLVMCTLHNMMEKIAMGASMHAGYGRGGNAIGHKWTGGGAEAVAFELEMENAAFF